MRTVLVIAATAVAASVIVPKYAMQIRGGAAPAAMAARPQMPVPAGPRAPGNSRSVVIPPGVNGHFQVEGRVDGRRLDFMVDTGASVVALTARDAGMLGIHPGANDYTALVKTANGTVHAAPVELNMVEIDDLVVHDVAALVLPDNALSDNLLGLSFLSRLHRYEYSEGKLVLEQ